MRSITGTQTLPATLTQTGSFTLNGATVNVTAGMTQAQCSTAINTANAGGLPGGMKPRSSRRASRARER
jgi:hypothetical protein